MEKNKKEKLGVRLVNGLSLSKEQLYYFNNFDESENSSEHFDYELCCKYEDYTINFFCDFDLRGGNLIEYNEEFNHNDIIPVEVRHLKIKSIWINRKQKSTNYDFNTLEFEGNDFNLSEQDMINLKYELAYILKSI